MAALSSMEYGRYCLPAATREQRQLGTFTHGQQQQHQTHTAEQGPHQRAITDFFNCSGASRKRRMKLSTPVQSSIRHSQQWTMQHKQQLDRAQARTVADFWTRLHSFAALGIPA
ncbi:hypothetical protein Vretimale_6748 [Volvox reticuliferus]|uniref:Uncharacterized protein n=1 Tax=Volvox reticuliferus TaxID=1737510 RepID=A0A8J4LM35_9CHLO|nr:hypothetical protein Vretimale_6748 [Volvox reticuliferus]